MAGRRDYAVETPRDEDEGKLFDVTCVIGSVRRDNVGSDYAQTPTEAALLLIARHDAAGDYTFPTQNGGVMRVSVYTENPPTGVEAPDAY